MFIFGMDLPIPEMLFLEFVGVTTLFIIQIIFAIKLFRSMKRIEGIQKQK
jgi:hypothetical protein